jgi:hypothetical protein
MRSLRCGRQNALPMQIWSVPSAAWHMDGRGPVVPNILYGWKSPGGGSERGCIITYCTWGSHRISLSIQSLPKKQPEPALSGPDADVAWCHAASVSEPCHKRFLTGHMKAYACSFCHHTMLACRTGILLSVRNGRKDFHQQRAFGYVAPLFVCMYQRLSRLHRHSLFASRNLLAIPRRGCSEHVVDRT